LGVHWHFLASKSAPDGGCPSQNNPEILEKQIGVGNYDEKHTKQNNQDPDPELDPDPDPIRISGSGELDRELNPDPGPESDPKIRG
jgi:hypothetical protein